MTPHPLAARLSARTLGVALALSLALATPVHAAWPSHAGNAQHTAVSSVPTQPLQAIHWQAPVDLNPQYSGDILFIHYGSPLVTEGNTVIFPVKVGVADTFRVEARAGLGGTVRWTLALDYTLPPHSWTPPVGLTLTPRGRMYAPGAGGTLLWTDALDSATPHSATRIAFFGNAAYAANRAAMDASLRVCTPLTSAANGTVYFGVRAISANPLGIASGIASVDASGNGRFVPVLSASSGLCSQVAMNCAPALSADGGLLYIAARGNTSSPGYLLALSTADLSTRAMAAPLDPITGAPSSVSGDGTAAPMVAPDGRVYYGVLGTPFGTNASRGWMLQFDSLLVATGAPGAFGWDHTPSLVPAAAVPGYAGSSPYLIMTKYNFYIGAGDGVNTLAILDPDATQIDVFTGETVMKEVRIIAGVTPDPEGGPSYPNAVKEWCINTAVVDPFTHSVLAGSEDGKLYRWELGSNTFSESVVLTPGLGEAYTPTMAGPDGQVYAINNATLFAVGATVVDVPRATAGHALALSPAHPNPFTSAATLRFTLAEASDVTIEVLDLAGRRVATLYEGAAAAGEHSVRWDGRDGAGSDRAAGMYVVRLSAGARSVTRKLLLLAR